jgi:hypothetical protein
MNTFTRANPLHDFDCISFIPPFKKTWFEFVNTWGQQQVGIYMTYKEAEYGYDVQVCWFNDHFRRRHIHNTDTARKYHVDFMGVEIFKVDQNGQFLTKDSTSPERHNIQVAPNSFLQDYVAKQGGLRARNIEHAEVETATQMAEIVSMGQSPVLWTALNFLHCKNMKTVQVPINKKARKAAIKANRPYFEKYYVLSIGATTKTLNKEGRAKELGLQKAFHICRGHFKTYTDKNPLFGKHTGTFWCPDHVKGSIDTGIVNKDYAINP